MKAYSGIGGTQKDKPNHCIQKLRFALVSGLMGLKA